MSDIKTIMESLNKLEESSMTPEIQDVVDSLLSQFSESFPDEVMDKLYEEDIPFEDFGKLYHETILPYAKLYIQNRL